MKSLQHEKSNVHSGLMISNLRYKYYTEDGRSYEFISIQKLEHKILILTLNETT
jgi:hypothetical protein